MRPSLGCCVFAGLFMMCSGGSSLAAPVFVTEADLGLSPAALTSTARETRQPPATQLPTGSPAVLTAQSAPSVSIPSTYAGDLISIPLTIDLAYRAGFRSEDALTAAVGLAIAESGLWTAARHWKPSEGFRPASDTIGVAGPPEAWSTDNKRQVHSDRGLWQLSSRWWGQFSDRAADSPADAAKAAFTVSRNGTDFSLWDSFRSGEAQKHYDEEYDGWPAIRPMVREFLAKQPRR